MGRFYYGDILGKFWFGIQSSYDPIHLGCKNSKRIYRYIKCICICNDLETKYCKNCYNNEDDHRKDTGITNDSLAIQTNETEWSFFIGDIETINNILNEIEKKINVQKYITNITITNNSDQELAYDIETTDKYVYCKDTKILELLARWCLGKKILKRLELKGKCTFVGED